MIRRPPRSTLFPYTNALPISRGVQDAAPHAEGGDRACPQGALGRPGGEDRKSTRLNSSHLVISYAVFCLKKKKSTNRCFLFRQPRPTQSISSYSYTQ